MVIPQNIFYLYISITYINTNKEYIHIYIHIYIYIYMYICICNEEKYNTYINNYISNLYIIIYKL